jgi:hypothetical protein
VQKLLEQPAQFERRALAAVGHHGRCNVARAIDLPFADRRAAQSWITLWAALAALSPLASDAALAGTRQLLPAGTRARTRRIPERDEAAAVASDDVETTIVRGLLERAAHGDAIAVAAGGGEADPVGTRRGLSGVALRLERAASIGNDVTFVVRAPCLLTILSLVTPELPPPGIFCDSAETTASMRQNREVGICLRHSCQVMPGNYSVAVGHLCLFPRRGGTSVVSIYRGRSASPFR